MTAQAMAAGATSQAGLTVEQVLDRAGTGAFQRRLFLIFGLVWAADAMQVLSVGIAAPSIAATFKLTLPAALQTGTVFFLGMLIGAAGFGRLADRIGRRNVLIATVALDGVAGLAAAFAPDFTTLLVLRFITGAAVGGTLPVDYAMMAEFLPADRRGRWLVALEGCWAIGTLLVAGIAWGASLYGIAETWRWIFGAAALPALIGIGLRFWVPESPHYLLRAGRPEEAKAVLDRVIAANGQPAVRERLAAPVVAPGDATGPFAPTLRNRTLLVLAVWFLVSISYYGVFTWLPGQLAGKGMGVVRAYGFLVLLALAQIPGYVLAAYGVERWGRRPTLVGFLLLSALACLIFVLATGQEVVLSAMMLLSFALLGTWGALYAFTPELYPTRARGAGMGSAGAAARLGGLLAPSALVPVVAVSFEAAVGLFSVLLLVAAACAASIGTETRRQPLS